MGMDLCSNNTRKHTGVELGPGVRPLLAAHPYFGNSLFWIKTSHFYITEKQNAVFNAFWFRVNTCFANVKKTGQRKTNKRKYIFLFLFVPKYLLKNSLLECVASVLSASPYPSIPYLSLPYSLICEFWSLRAIEICIIIKLNQLLYNCIFALCLLKGEGRKW